MKYRCINLDWLEIFAEEPPTAPRDADYFRERGYKVKVRAYGTPQYREMFTLIAGGVELFEIRRNPYSLKSEGGIFNDRACHIRLCNQTCYEYAPVDHLRSFMLAHDYTYKSISRIDIALDFNEFDNGEDPAKFIMKYMRGRYSKINQSRVSAHGQDSWSERVFNSLKWGSPSSPVTTKLYNKTLELKQGEDKPWIRQAWEDAKLDTSHDVWRVEFSLTAQMQTLKSLASGEMFKKSICHYDSRERLLKQFFILYNKYFDFRKLLTNRKSDGRLIYVRKYNCPRLELFKPNEAIWYTPARNVTKKKRPDRIYKMLCNKLADIVDDKNSTVDEVKAAQVVISWLLKRMQIENERVHGASNAMIFELERAHQAITIEANPAFEDFQRTVMYSLMRKFGVVEYTPPDDLPF